MGGFLIIEDGRACAPNNWGYDAMIDAIANALAVDGKHNDLANG